MQHQIEFKVDGIHCQSCVKKIKEALAFTYPRLEVHVSVDEGSVQVGGEDKLSTMGIKKEIEELGFPVVSFKKG